MSRRDSLDTPPLHRIPVPLVALAVAAVSLLPLACDPAAESGGDASATDRTAQAAPEASVATEAAVPPAEASAPVRLAGSGPAPCGAAAIPEPGRRPGATGTGRTPRSGTVPRRHRPPPETSAAPTESRARPRSPAARRPFPATSGAPPVALPAGTRRTGAPPAAAPTPPPPGDPPRSRPALPPHNPSCTPA